MNGLSVLIPGTHEFSREQGVLCLEGIALKVRPVGVLQKGTKTIVRLAIDKVVKGEAEWVEINRALWPHVVEKDRIVRVHRNVRRVGSFLILTIIIATLAFVMVHRHAGIQLSLLN